MSENDTNKLIDNTEALKGDALLHAMRLDMQQLFALVKGLDQKVDSLDQRVETLDQRVEALDQKVDARLRDTTPMWEIVVSRLDAIVAEQQSQSRRLDAIEGRLEIVETELRHLRRRIEGMTGELSRDVLEVRATQRDLEVRIEKLEKRPV